MSKTKSSKEFNERLYRRRMADAADAGLKRHNRSKGDAITPAHVEVQKLAGHPGYDIRYHVEEAPSIFRAMPLGSTLDG